MSVGCGGYWGPMRAAARVGVGAGQGSRAPRGRAATRASIVKTLHELWWGARWKWKSLSSHVCMMNSKHYINCISFRKHTQVLSTCLVVYINKERNATYLKLSFSKLTHTETANPTFHTIHQLRQPLKPYLIWLTPSTTHAPLSEAWQQQERL